MTSAATRAINIRGLGSVAWPVRRGSWSSAIVATAAAWGSCAQCAQFQRVD
jgi:hypothetical protein